MTPMAANRPLDRRRWFAVSIALVLAGCAALPNDDVSELDQFVRDQYGARASWQQDAPMREAARAAAARALENPLDGDGAVVLALGLSPAFQALLSDAAAQTARSSQSARPANPIFTFERLTRREDGVVDLDIGRMLSVSIIDLLYLPTRLRAAETAQVQIRLRGAAAAVEAATSARQAWVRAVAAQQALTYHAQVMEAAEAGAELARRMQQAGNFSRLQQARQQAFYADAAVQLARARQAAVAAREALVRSIGLDATLAEKLVLPARLPDLPAKPVAPEELLKRAFSERLDVRIAEAEIETLGRRAGFVNTTSVLNSLHLAAVSNSATGHPRQRGVEVELALPLFDWGTGARSAAQAEMIAAVHRAVQTSIDAESGVREQYAAYRSAWDLAEHYRTEVVPLRKAIADEMQLKYNGMLVSVFDLLAESRSQIASVIQAIDAQRDFWLADAALQATLLGKPTTMSLAPAGVDSAPAAGH